jgi:hypothetical protein
LSDPVGRAATRDSQRALFPGPEHVHGMKAKS